MTSSQDIEQKMDRSGMEKVTVTLKQLLPDCKVYSGLGRVLFDLEGIPLFKDDSPYYNFVAIDGNRYSVVEIHEDMPVFGADQIATELRYALDRNRVRRERLWINHQGLRNF
mgnify:CR=1 FL=1